MATVTDAAVPRRATIDGSCRRAQATLAILACLAVTVPAQEESSRASSVEPRPADMAPYRQTVPGTDVAFDMVPVPGGTFWMGSPADEPGRHDDEGPQHRVRIAPLWFGKCEVTWEEYELWAYHLDGSKSSAEVDAVARPTPPYCDMTFGMGHDGYPAICMTQHAAKTYCAWLSAKTGRTYRLPTEAEWEWACRAGTTSPWSFGDDVADLGDYAWFASNSAEEYHPVGIKKANPWGLFDMHGNVAEWVLDQYRADAYAQRDPAAVTVAPLIEPTTLYPRVVRGGSWMDPPERLRSAARRGSDPLWKDQDPQIPKSVWYHTDAPFVGFRVVRPWQANADDPPSTPHESSPKK